MIMNIFVTFFENNATNMNSELLKFKNIDWSIDQIVNKLKKSY
jgi:hypothetical protein